MLRRTRAMLLRKPIRCHSCVADLGNKLLWNTVIPLCPMCYFVGAKGPNIAEIQCVMLGIVCVANLWRLGAQAGVVEVASAAPWGVLVPRHVGHTQQVEPVPQALFLFSFGGTCAAKCVVQSCL